MSIKILRGKTKTVWFPLSSAYGVSGKGQFMMASSGEAIQASSGSGVDANVILGLYTGPAITTGNLTAGTTRIPVQVPEGVVYIEDTATSGAFTSGTIGLNYGLSSGSATGNFSASGISGSTGHTQHIGYANTTYGPFTHAGFGASSGANIFAWSGGNLQARNVT